MWFLGSSCRQELDVAYLILKQADEGLKSTFKKDDFVKYDG